MSATLHDPQAPPCKNSRNFDQGVDRGRRSAPASSSLRLFSLIADDVGQLTFMPTHCNLTVVYNRDISRASSAQRHPSFLL